MTPPDDFPPDAPYDQPGWRLASFHAHQHEGASTAFLALTDQEGKSARAKGEGPTAHDALLDALAKLTGHAVVLTSARIYAAGNGGNARAQAHLILTDDQGERHAGFGWAPTEFDAFIAASLRVANRLDENAATDSYCSSHAERQHGWRKPRPEARSIAA
ncbi:MAG: alpha-isopropylmalate synthase regulatory domain-containing protein [Pseudomonadota bacterium]